VIGGLRPEPDSAFVCYRIGAPRGEFPIYDARGSSLFPGRWNTSDTPVIYASENYSTAMLEKLVHGNGHLPPDQHYVVISIPVGTSYEEITADTLPDWDAPEPTTSRDFGATWVRERRSAVLLVPSFVVRLERNVVINPAHPDAARIAVGAPQPVWWDRRLFNP
jgi:RES domain-containing protein